MSQRIKLIIAKNKKMEFKIFGGEKMTPEQKNLESQRKAYEKQADKDAKKQNSFLENLTGKGIDKEDVMIVDAKREDGYMDRVENQDGSYVELLEEAQKSSLTFNESRSLMYDAEKNTKGNFVMEGLIAGKKVKIKGVTEDYNSYIMNSGNILKITGTIEGKPISSAFAFELFDKYYGSAETRSGDIRRRHEEVQNLEKERKEEFEFERQERKEEQIKQKFANEDDLKADKKGHADIL